MLTVEKFSNLRFSDQSEVGSLPSSGGQMLDYPAVREHILRMMKGLSRFSKVFKFRKRKIFTKNNKLRLRYSAAIVILSCSALAFASDLPSVSLPSFDLSAHFASNERVAEASVDDKDVLVRVEQEAVEANAEDDTILSQVNDEAKSIATAGLRRAAALIKKAEEPKERAIKINSGGTVAGAIQSTGIDSREAYFAVQAMAKEYDPRQIKAGQVVNIHFAPQSAEDGGKVLDKLVVNLTPAKAVVVTKNGEEFVASMVEKDIIEKPYVRSAKIQTSLYGSAAKAGIPPQVIAKLIRTYSWNVDFQRDIRQGDLLEVLYTVRETEDGDFVEYGDVAFANLAVGGRPQPIYRFETADGRVDYFDPKGHSVRKTLMKTPIDGARLSSGYGMRHHPVLGYDKMHKGLDFAAPTGTPIYAAGDGVIEYASRKGSYGNYLRIRHNGTLKTAYAHLHKFGKGVSVGKRVKQGDIVAYVGTTGRSTGPHLHYEVLVNNVQANPNRLDLPVGEQLKGTELAKFEALVGDVKQQYASLGGGLKLADAKQVQVE
jgi:murein DD-endopeptidase MepM/ murein hydrolase activator NlpD